LKTINLYYRTKPTGYKFIPGDRPLVRFFRRLIFCKKVSGVEKVFINLCKGFDELKIKYTVNLSFNKIKPDEPVVVLGYGRYALQGYTEPNRIIAGIGLMTHPGEWPDLFTAYPVAKYMQHSKWTNALYAQFYGKEQCAQWPAGIDTEKWKPPDTPNKKLDVLIYNKIMWDREQTSIDLKLPIIKKLEELGLSHKEIVYGRYTEAEYHTLLQDCRAVIFLCEHESQGFACCEAMAMDVPVLAWDQGYWLDPNRFAWGTPIVKATSVPFFDERCGMTFTNANDFNKKINVFWHQILNSGYQPRTYIVQNLTLQLSAQRMLALIDLVYNDISSHR
jgi:hypothetical protein